MLPEPLAATGFVPDGQTAAFPSGEAFSCIVRLDERRDGALSGEARRAVGQWPLRLSYHARGSDQRWLSQTHHTMRVTLRISTCSHKGAPIRLLHKAIDTLSIDAGKGRILAETRYGYRNCQCQVIYSVEFLDEIW